MVGNAALMRLSEVISWPPGASGTLKSTRMKMRFPLRSRSRIESFGMSGNRASFKILTSGTGWPRRVGRTVSHELFLGLGQSAQLRGDARHAVGFEQRSGRRSVLRWSNRGETIAFEQCAKPIEQ